MRRILTCIMLLVCALVAGAQVQPRPGGSSQISGVSGNGHTLATVNGPLTPGDCDQNDANGNLIDSGSPCSTGGSSGSARVVYTSKIAGVTGGVAVVPGSSATGTTDSATAINAAIAGGNVDLEVDSGYALSTSLVLSSNTTIHCVARQYGFIMQTSSNSWVLQNANMNAPTTANGNGYDVSNQTDQNIRIEGCQLNANSTQAVTGTDFTSVAHKVNPSNSMYVMGVFFSGINHFWFENNELYDSGLFGMSLSNMSNVRIRGNYVHQPSPIVQNKNTDGIHFFGPDVNLWVSDNRVNAGDDSIAFNADDGNRPCESDPAAAYLTSYTWLKWGPIKNVWADNNHFDGSTAGYRLYSVDSLEDNINWTNTSGITTGESSNITTAGSGTCGATGNIGKVIIRGFQVQSTGAWTNFYQAGLYTTANITSLEFDDVQVTDPGATWPIFYQGSGTIRNLILEGWQISTQSTVLPLVVKTSGTVNSLSGTSLVWDDNTSHTGSFYGGTTVPPLITVSNYTGPNRLLASGYSPVIRNGDAFTNTYSTVYVNTIFSEHSSGALATTTPATCANGCTGTWTAAAGGPSSGVWTYGTNQVSLGLNNTCTSGGSDNYCPVYINAGTDNYTLRFNVSQLDSSTATALSPVVRWTNNANFTTIVHGGSGWEICDVVSGVTTCGTAVAFGQVTGVYTVVANGTAISLTNSAGTVSGTVSSSNTATNVGFNSTSANTGTSLTLSSVQVSSQ